MASLPHIPMTGLPPEWRRYLHDTLMQHLRTHRGVTGLPPKTTAERDEINAKNGDMIYNTTTDKGQIYEAGSWRDL